MPDTTITTELALPPEVASAMRVHIQAALEGMERLLEASEPTDELVQHVLERMGDAMRAALEVPAQIRRWLAGLPAARLTGALRLSIAEVAESVLPRSATDESLAFILARRDAAESLRVATAGWCLTNGRPPAALAGHRELVDALVAFDTRLRDVAVRHIAEALLGERASLLGMNAWTAALHEPAADVFDESAPAWDDAMLGAPPSDELVTSYVLDGSLAHYIEAFAARSAPFAEELAAVIDAALADRSGVGLAARRWRKHAAAPHEFNPMA